MTKVALITGAGRRIGKHLALGFARQGWDVAVHYGHSKDEAEGVTREIESMGSRAFTVQADMRNREQARAAVFAAAEHFGRLDVLVNNAGTYPEQASIADVTEEMWRTVIETNLFGEFFAAQAAAEVMQRTSSNASEDQGRIINISSLGAFQIWKDRIPYHVSKAGVVQLTKALARSLAPGISVNSVAPGAIDIPDDPAGKMTDPRRIPMQRHGSAEDVFNAVWFFANSSTYVTGQTLIVDGGLNIAQETSQD